MKIIVATDSEWGIGKNNELLFHIPEDMKFFKHMTMNKAVVMGRKTYESIGHPLSNRMNFVLTSGANLTINEYNCYFVGKDSLESILGIFDTDDIIIIGGESVYKKYISRCDVVYRTHYHKKYNADAYFPALPTYNFVLDKVLYEGVYDNYPYEIELWFKLDKIEDNMNNNTFTFS